MHYVYFLKDTNSEWIYIGYTSDLRRRLEEHKQGKTFTTKRFSSIELVYYEAFKSAEDAQERGKEIKTIWQFLRNVKEKNR
ncbi:MAG: GIY-YIG nuclease family protein [Thermodesulfobacteriota bacterium]|nr:GIY-YIG nuclease family protein [Thermodesulfobacteriota bacterium]